MDKSIFERIDGYCTFRNDRSFGEYKASRKEKYSRTF